MTRTIPKIPASEWEVMEVLWSDPRLTGAEVHERLSTRHDWKPKTVNTFLARLVERGVLEAERVGKAYRYTPRVDRVSCVRAESANFVRRVLGGQWSPLVLQLVESADLTETDIEELETLLREKRREVGE